MAESVDALIATLHTACPYGPARKCFWHAPDPARMRPKACPWIGHPAADRVAERMEAMRREERERCAKIAADWALNYPTDVFIEPSPGEHGESVDACSARAERHAAKNISELILAELEGR